MPVTVSKVELSPGHVLLRVAQADEILQRADVRAVLGVRGVHQRLDRLQVEVPVGHPPHRCVRGPVGDLAADVPVGGNK